MGTSLEVNTYYSHRIVFSPKHPGYFIARLAASPIVLACAATLSYTQSLYYHARLLALYNYFALSVALFCIQTDKRI